VNVAPSTPRGAEFHKIRPPVGLDVIAHAVKRPEHLVLERAVDVDVDVSMRPSLMTHERVHAPTSFEPEPDADETHGLQHGEHLLEGHILRPAHGAILTGNRQFIFA
jgi:hypothetical protein